MKKKKGAVSIPVVVEGPKKDDTHRVTHPEHEEMQALLKRFEHACACARVCMTSTTFTSRALYHRYPFHRCVSCRAVMSPLRVEGITHCPLGRNGHILRLASLAELADVTVPDGFPLHTAKLSVEGKGGSRGGSSAAASHSLLVQSHTHLASSPFAMQRMEPTQTPALELLKDLPNREAAVHAARQTVRVSVCCGRKVTHTCAPDFG